MTETAVALVTFHCERYPELKVLLGSATKERGVANHYAEFHGGTYTTADAEEIAALDKCPEVTRDTGVRYVCPTCGLKFWSAQGFAAHVVSHQPKEF